MAAPTKDALRSALLDKHGINWPLTADELRAYDSAIDTALSRLGKFAGSEKLCIFDADTLDLLLSAAWYVREDRWPEFVENYRSDLLTLRLREAFDCGV